MTFADSDPRHYKKLQRPRSRTIGEMKEISPGPRRVISILGMCLKTVATMRDVSYKQRYAFVPESRCILLSGRIAPGMLGRFNGQARRLSQHRLLAMTNPRPP